MPRSTMKVALIRHTLSPEEVVALGAGINSSDNRSAVLLPCDGGQLAAARQP